MVIRCSHIRSNPAQYVLSCAMLVLLITSALTDGWTQNWPRFRGPDGSGIAPFARVAPIEDGTPWRSLAWKTPLALPGSNSPVIWGNRVFVTGADKQRRAVYCVDAGTGKLLWTKPVGGDDEEAPRTHGMTGYAAPTATTDGELVYAVFPTGHLVALDFSGKLVWQRRFDMTRDIYGHATSLVLHNNLLIVQIDLGKPDIGESHMLALNRSDGKTVWDIHRPVQGSWTTPIVIDTGKREELVTSAKPWVIAYHPETGREFWRVKCVEGDSAPSPIYANGLIYVANIYASLVAIRPGGAGDVTGTHVNFSVKGSLPDICSPLSDGERVFVLSTNGILSCYGADTGNLLWSEKLGERFRSSPSLFGNSLYLFSEKGDCIVATAANTYRMLGSASLGEPVYSCPSFSAGRMYVRGEEHLFCIGL